MLTLERVMSRYLKTTHDIGNAHRFGKGVGIDVRGAHGYVVGPGCTFRGKPYVVRNDVPVAGTPTWIMNDYFVSPGAKDEQRDEPVVDDLIISLGNQSPTAFSGAGDVDAQHQPTCGIDIAGTMRGQHQLLRRLRIISHGWPGSRPSCRGPMSQSAGK